MLTLLLIASLSILNNPLDPLDERKVYEFVVEQPPQYKPPELLASRVYVDPDDMLTLVEYRKKLNPEPDPVLAPPSTIQRNVWDRLAECESGNWIDGGVKFEIGSARWYWARPGTRVPPWGTTIHHGGLQFHPNTWNDFKLDGYPQFAYDATREQQIAVAERVLDAQGWGAWPVCSRKLGLR